VTANFATAGDSRPIERRRATPPDEPPIEVLQRMPALVVLERLPAPALAVDRAGNILFANRSFCQMLGYASAEVSSMKIDDIFGARSDDDRWVALIGTDSDRLIELRHRSGHCVRASMSKSAMRRREDTVALVTFHDRTEEIWCSDVDDHAVVVPAKFARWV
jgi:PAS domain S-box-containing protein